MVKATDENLTPAELVAYCEQNEETLKFPLFNSDVVWNLGNALRSRFLKQYAEKPSAGIVIQIRHLTGPTHQILFSTQVGSPKALSADNWLWVEGKSRVVERFGKASFRVGREMALKGKNPDEAGLGMDKGYACHGGGFPVYLTNSSISPVGIILVSGLPQKEDHQLIVDTLEEFLPTLKA